MFQLKAVFFFFQKVRDEATFFPTPPPLFKYLQDVPIIMEGTVNITLIISATGKKKS